MKILNFGSCNIDYVYSLDHIVGVGETEATDLLSVFAGGKGLNQSIALSRAGAQVYHAGCIGEDGEFLAELLSECGVNVEHLGRVEGRNGHAIIQVSRTGQNSIFVYPGSNAMITHGYVDTVLSHFSSGDVILLQNEISCLDYIIEMAYQKGMCIVLNPSPCSGAVGAIDLSKISYLILNEHEAKTLSGGCDAEAALAFFAQRYRTLCVMLTLGEDGSVYQAGGEKIYQASYKVTAVDTTAAGDTFTGYFLAGLARGDRMEDILRIASCASAIAVSRKGAAPSIPTRQEVLEMSDSVGAKQN